MKHFFWVTVLVFSFVRLSAQIPTGYYSSATGLSGTALQSALHNIIDGHNQLSYSDLWDAVESTDKKSNGYVWDMYSDVPGGNPPYNYTFFSDQCGNYSGEGDCYNREHSFPKSWFGGTVYPMYTDLFMVYPTDGYVNGKRGNHPFGEVSSSSWVSENGSKVGSCGFPGYSGTVFEPIDAYKGDFARTYFYVMTRYYNEDGSWPGSDMFDGAQPKAWALNLLYDWHSNDPVSSKETNRNNAAYQLQDNRNPFIDHPEWIDAIWFSTAINENILNKNIGFELSPNPANEQVRISIKKTNKENQYSWTLRSADGKCLKTGSYSDNCQIATHDLSAGIYFVLILDQSQQISASSKLVIF
jgi:endonuclease I